MRSAASAFALALALAAPAGSARAAGDAAPSRDEVRAAAARVASDPNLATKVKEKTLRLKPDDARRDKAAREAPSLAWLAQFMGWLTETARLLVWLAGALAVALLLVGLRRWIRARAEAASPRYGHLPSHVQSLDIRPESLPDLVGAAAAAAWERGEHRAALSLLYRGALSRLVHDHAVPIRAASTEGECLELATRRVDGARGEFFARLVRAWQLAVYGARLPPASQALALCRDFDVYLRALPKREPVQ